MVVCVAPVQGSLTEMLTTLRYADKARRIINRPTVNEGAGGLRAPRGERA